MFSCCKKVQVNESESNAPRDASSTVLKVEEDEYTFSCSNETLVKPPKSLPRGYPIFVVDSKDSNIFILDASVQATLECLENCKVIIGPTESSLFVRECKNTTIIGYCHQFRARDCFNIKLHLHCATEPVIETSKDILFHPNTLTYDALNSQLYIAGLSDKPNKWNLIYDFNDSWPKNYSISNECCVLDTSKLLEFKVSI